MSNQPAARGVELNVDQLAPDEWCVVMNGQHAITIIGRDAQALAQECAQELEQRLENRPAGES